MKLVYSLFLTALTLSTFGTNAQISYPNDYGQSTAGYYDSFAQRYDNQALQDRILESRLRMAEINSIARTNPQYGNPDYYNLPPVNQPYYPPIQPIVFPDQPGYQQPYQPGYTNQIWRPYRNALDAKYYGVSSGSPNIFVGGGNFPQQSGPALLDNGGCYFPYNRQAITLRNCQYLVNEPGRYQWIPSSNGIYEQGAVLYGGIPVGRARHPNTGVYRVGKISQNQGGLLYTADRRENFAYSYDALVDRQQRIQY